MYRSHLEYLSAYLFPGLPGLQAQLSDNWAVIPLFGGMYYLIGRAIQGSNWKTIYEAQ
jgi:hypothetical protein